MSDTGEKKDWFDKLFGRWWGKCLFGLVLILVGALLFSEFTKLDSGEKESMRVNWVVAILYKIGGRWLASGVLWLGGLACLAFGIKQVVAPKKADEPSPPPQPKQ